MLNRSESELTVFQLGGGEVAVNRGENRRVLFVQATNPGAYPPLIHASMLMAEAGWEVTFLSAPIDGNELALDPHPRIKIHAVRTRPSHVMSKVDYAVYAAAAARLAAATSAERRLCLGSSWCRTGTSRCAACRRSAGLS